MFEIDMGSVVRATQEPFKGLVRKSEWAENGSYSATGIEWTLDVQVWDEEKNEQRQFVRFMFVFPHKMFMAIGNFDTEYKMTSGHDSCYVDDGIDSPLSKLYFVMCERVNEDRAKQHKKHLAPIQMRSKIYITNTKLVWVTMKNSDDDNMQGYWKKISKIEEYKK